MIDLHNHVIYDFDDGPKTIDESLDMLNNAALQGITDVFATSHFNEIINKEMERDYFSKLSILRQMLLEQKINIRVHSGSEMFFHHFMEYTIKKTRVATLGNQGLYILIEFPLYLLPTGVEDALFKLDMEGYIPIVAHPERYSALHDRPEKILNFIRYGGLLQINVGSVLGDFGRTTKKIAMWLLENQYANFLSSDAHVPRGRSFKLAQAVSYLKEYLDRDYLNTLVRNNPQKIIQNERIDRINIAEPTMGKGFIQRFKEKLGLI